METLTLSSALPVDHLPPTRGISVEVVPTQAEIDGLIERFDFIAVTDVCARLKVRKVAKDCWDVTGHLSANVTQRCVVTGEPVPELVDFMIEERYVRHAEDQDSVEVELDGVEPLVDGAIDLGEMVTQSLGVAVTPWPRSATATDHLESEEEKDNHPFASLAALKKPE
jgi:uncharacterized metal-binding protein YceD (DUF177 family)